MADERESAITQRDRDLLRAVLQGASLEALAGRRGQSADRVRDELHRLLVTLLHDRPPVAPETGGPTPRP